MSRVPQPGDGCRIDPAHWPPSDVERLDQYAAALASSRLDAVIAVADRELQALRDDMTDAAKALERVREVAALWESVDPAGLMTRAWAGEHLRLVVGP